jgi:signal transduction histidine kinase
VPAIEALLDRRRSDGLEITSDVALASDPDADVLDSELETTIYRLAQETLTNIVKHARASHVHVSIHHDGSDLTLEIKDDGVGFDPEQRSAGFGLGGMRERVYLAGGTLEVNSAPGRGTLVRARLPVGRSASAPNLGADQLAL